VQPTAGTATPRRSRSRILPLIVLAVLGLAAFRGPLAGRLFYLRDIVQNHVPMRHLVAERMRAGELPLWDPYHGGGTPLLANPDNLVLHPLSLLFLALPFNVAFTASILLQYALMMAGGYLLARRTGAAPEGATLAAAIFGLSGPAASLASMHNVLSAAAWVPLGLWALLSGLDRRDGRRLALAAACLAVVLVAAEPASLLAFLLLALALAAVPAAGTRAVPWRLAPIFGVGLLLACVQLLPARALIAVATRGAGFTQAEGLKWSLRPGRLLELLVPRLFGDPTRLSPEAWWGRWAFEGGYPFLLSIYLGPIVCGCALLGLWRGRLDSRRRRGLAIVAALGMLLALGRQALIGRWLFAVLPAARQIRYPERFLLVALFAIGLLAAHGLSVLADESAPRRRAVIGLFAAAGCLFAAAPVLAASPAAADHLLAALGSVPSAFMAGEAGAVVRGQLLLAALWAFGEAAALAAGAAILWRAPSRGARAIAGWGLVAAAGLSMVFAAAPALSTAAPGWMDAPSPLRPFLETGPGAARLHHTPRPGDLRVWGTTDELIWGYRFDRFTYTLATGHVDRVPTVFDAATDRMDLADQSAVATALPALSPAARLKVLSVAGAGYLLSYEKLDQADLEPGPVLESWSAPPPRLYRLRSRLPRARLVSLARRPAHPGNVAESLADPEYDPRRMVLLDEASATTAAAPVPDATDTSPSQARVIPSAPLGEARVIEDAPERVRIAVQAAADGYLVLADAWAPGWTAAVDGAPARLLRADGLFRAVPVPAGAHEVSMSYRPPGLIAGTLLSVAGALLALLWCAVDRPRR
jgi:hypothetical protein